VENLHIRTGDQLDATTLYAILTLRSDVFVIEQDCAYQDLDGLDLESSTRHLWFADDGPRPLAYLRILEEPDGEARIGRVCVSASARRRGLAGRLLTVALDAIGDRESVLAAQVYAADLYTAAGFVADGPEFLEDGIPHVPMRRSR
jgi:ElaA protein